MTDVEIRPATSFPDVAAVLGARGGTGGCWCSFWRLNNQETNATTEGDREAQLRALVDGDTPPGLVLYADGAPAGWVAVAPRDSFHRIGRTKGLEYADDEAGVWSITCLYVAKAHRGRGYTDELIAAAADYALSNGAQAVESYPVADPEQGRKNGLSTGTLPMYEQAGFTVHRDLVAGRRLIMRKASA